MKDLLEDVRFIIGIAAGKGGVGKSTLTVNLALALEKMGLKVGVMDADIYGPSMRRMLPEDALPSTSEKDPNKIVPASRGGIKYISMSHFQSEAMVVRAPIANSLIKKFLHAVEWGSLDCLLIDFPPGTGDIQLSIMQEGSLSGGVVVTTPQEVALQDVVKAIALFHHMQVPMLGLVENMSYFKDPLTDRYYFPFGQGGGQRLCKQEHLPFLGTIPVDEEISRCCDEGLSLLEEAEGKESALAFEQIAKSVFDQLLAFEKLESTMHHELIFIRKIFQNDQYRFTIEWTDDKIGEYRLSDLQRHCSCARCRDEKTGRSLISPEMIDPDVQAIKMERVGRYALRIDFTSGCSKGIYAFSLLRKLGSCYSESS